MSASLHELLGLGWRELVSIVGAGGKSTILLTLGAEFGQAGSKVILTTTTRMAEYQRTDPTCWSDDPGAVDADLEPGRPLFLLTGRDGDKISGPPPESVNRLFAETTVDHLIVEADGARRMAFKAPADHEPVIPSASTTVIVVASINAIGEPISKVAHRPERVASLIGCTPSDVLTVEGAATVLSHRDGGLKGIPSTARTVIVITQVTPATQPTADALTGSLVSDAGVDSVVTMVAIPPSAMDEVHPVP